MFLSFCSRRLDGKVIAAVLRTVLAVLVSLANPNHFLQNFDFFNGEKQIRLVLLWYENGLNKSHRGKSARLEVAISQSGRQSAVSFELHRGSQVIAVLLFLVPHRITLRD